MTEPENDKPKTSEELAPPGRIVGQVLLADGREALEIENSDGSRSIWPLPPRQNRSND